MGTTDAAGNLIGGDFGGWRTLTVSLVLIHAVVRCRDERGTSS